MRNAPMTLFAYTTMTLLNAKWSGFHRSSATTKDYEHANPYHELIMVAEGPIFLQTEHKKHELKTGDCFILRPWESHFLWRKADHESSFFWVQFVANPYFKECHPEALPRIFEQNQQLRSKQELRSHEEEQLDVLLLPRHDRPTRRYELLRLFEQLHDEMQKPLGYFRHRSTLLLSQILHLLAEDLLAMEHVQSRIPTGYIAYRKLVSYLHENYHEELKPPVIEQMLERNYEYICHIFKQYSGMTISIYIQWLRMQRSRFLLQTTAADIHDIANQVGYQDPYYFSRVFKRHHGMSPSEFRSQDGERVTWQPPTLDHNT
jgi:AraC-like DNA-binding protein